MPRSPIDRVVRAARRRLVAQSLLDRLAIGLNAALAVGLAYILAEPLLIDPVPEGLRWGVVGGLAGLAVAWALVQTVRTFPTRLATALAVDSRFQLCERLTSVIGLPENLHDTPAGRAVVADAEKHADGVKVRSEFGVAPGRSALWVPGLAAAVAVVAFVYHPIIDSPAWAEAKQKQADKDGPKRADGPGRRPDPPASPKKRPDTADRPNKSEKLKELEAELDRLERAAQGAPDKPAEAREKVTEITAATEKAKRFEQEQFDRLSRMEQQLRRLEKLTNTDNFKDGPAQKFNDALAKGDLGKAQEQADELRKKAKKKELTPDEQKQLDKQFDQMQNELQRLARNQEQQDKLKDLIDKAKQDGRDPESLERELDRLKQEAKSNPANHGLQDLAQKLQQAQQAMKNGDLEEVAKQMEQVAGQLGDLQGEIKDLEDVQEHLQRLKEMKQAAARVAQGQGDGTGGATAQGRGQGQGNGPNATGAGQASGARPENPNAPTARGEDERQRTPFDPRGRKTYGGATTGPAFTKRSPTELSPAIEQAVQEAAEALDAQKVSRDDREAVKEFFQRLGNQRPNP